MIVLESYPTPEVGQLEIHHTVDVRISAEQAREKVGFWLMDQVSMMMQAESPTFILGERAVWRVPAVQYSTHKGRVGKVGTVDIDAMTGEILADADETIETFAPIAQEMLATLPPFKRMASVPEQYIPQHLPRAPIAQLPLD